MNKPSIVFSLVFAIMFMVTIDGLTSTTKQYQTPNSNVVTLQEQGNKNRPKPDPLGKELPIEFRCLGDFESDGIQARVLPSGQTLVGVCNLLVLLDEKSTVVWQYRVPQNLFGFEYLQSTGLIYGTAGDNTFFILESSTGEELVMQSRNGAAAYGQVKQYGNDICLITDNNWGYRDRLSDPSIKDAVTAWRGTEKLWSVDLPPGADLVVNGNSIFAITKRERGLFIKEIHVPKTKS